MGAALNRWRELQVQCTASASRSSAEAASSVLSSSPESWIARVGRGNSSTRHYHTSLPYPLCHTVSALPSLPYHLCHTLSAIPSLPYPLCQYTLCPSTSKSSCPHVCPPTTTHLPTHPPYPSACTLRPPVPPTSLPRPAHLPTRPTSRWLNPPAAARQ